MALILGEALQSQGHVVALCVPHLDSLPNALLQQVHVLVHGCGRLDGHRTRAALHRVLSGDTLHVLVHDVLVLKLVVLR
eukprot:11218478-Lingulodinium_polyedra.AAC.1